VTLNSVTGTRLIKGVKFTCWLLPPAVTVEG